MAVGDWLRVFDAVSGLVQMSGHFRRSGDDPPSFPQRTGPLGTLETRLAGIVVAALKEAFDRDRARMDLERTHLDAERQRAEEALRAELRRQAAERALGHVRLVAVIAVGVWMLSAAIGVWLPGMRALVPKTLLGAGWTLSIAALGCAFVAWQHVSVWSARDSLGSGERPSHSAERAAPWLLLASLVLTGASLIAAL